MESINLIEDIQNTNSLEGGSKEDIFTTNSEGDSYSRYLELLDTFCKQSVKSKFNNNYDFFVDDDGNYVKNALDEKDSKNNMVVLKPKYINIKSRLNELNEIIKNKEYLLRRFRTELLNNNESVKPDFDATLEEYNDLITQRNSINEYNNKVNKISENKDIINKLKLDNINLNLEQYNTLSTIQLREANEEETINKYLLNNEAINSNNWKVKSLKNKQLTEFIVKEVFNNNTPVKKTIKFKKIKKSTKTKKEESEDAGAIGATDATTDAATDATTDATDATELEEVDLSKKSKPKKEIKTKTDAATDATELEEVDLSKKSKQQKEIKTKTDASTDATDATELEEVDLGLKAEELDLGDDLEALQPVFDEGDEENEEYVFNKSKPSKGADEDKNIPLKLGNKSDEANVTSKDTESIDKGKEVKVKVKVKVPSIDKGKGKSKEGAEDELDLESLSKKLNKKVTDPNIKIIRVDPNLQFSNISSAKCDDSNTIRSDVETTNVAGGKKRRKKGMDPDLKNCMFPFKEGNGKKAVMNTECSETGIENWCATERNEDCSAEKWAYCKSEK
jgi:hypothetical protein